MLKETRSCVLLDLVKIRTGNGEDELETRLWLNIISFRQSPVERETADR